MPKPANHRTTILDVAREAKVSATTVSHALNGKGYVDRQTRERGPGGGQGPGLPAGHPGAAPADWQGPVDRPAFLHAVQCLRRAGAARLPHGDRRHRRLGGPGQGPGAHAGAALRGQPVSPSTGWTWTGRSSWSRPRTTRRWRSSRTWASPWCPSAAFPAQPVLPYVDLHSRATALLLLEHLAGQGARRTALMIGSSARNSYLESEEAYGAFCAGRGQAPIVVKVDEQAGEAGGWNGMATPVAGPSGGGRGLCHRGHLRRGRGGRPPGSWGGPSRGTSRSPHATTGCGPGSANRR